MQRFKLGFRNKSVLEQLAICDRALAGLTANIATHADASLVTKAQATVDALRASQERVNSLQAALKSELSRRNELLRQARKQVTNASLGGAIGVQFDPAKMLGLGLELEKPKSVRVGLPPVPEDFHAEPMANEGAVRLTWRRTLRRDWFEISYSTDPNATEWQLMDTSFRQSCVIEGLVSGQKYWFRVRAANTNGRSAWSGFAVARVK